MLHLIDIFNVQMWSIVMAHSVIKFMGNLKKFIFNFDFLPVWNYTYVVLLVVIWYYVKFMKYSLFTKVSLSLPYF